LISEEVRKVRDELRSLEKELDGLKEDDNQNFGKDLEFFYLKNQCFESKSVEYTYKVCPFGSAKQDSVDLGRFHAIEEKEGRGHVMEFTEGTKCWGGPARSMSVRLICGLEEHLRDVEEPSRCAYSATLSTPAVCSKEYALKLGQTLQEDGVLLNDDVIPFI
jgi:protein kinase C substrate 80K-H